MKKAFVQKVKASLPTLFGVGFLVALWWICAALIGNKYLMVSPWETVKSAVRILGTGAFYGAVGATLLRALLVTAVSAVGAIPLAACAFAFPKFAAFLTPSMATLRALPTLAVLLALIVALGERGATVAVGVTAVLPILYTSVYNAIVGVDEKVVEACKAYRVPIVRQVTGVYLPHALPKTVSGLGAAASFALKIIVSAEILCATVNGLGGMMQEAKLLSQLGELAALTACVCIVGMMIEGVTAWLARRLGERFL